MTVLSSWPDSDSDRERPCRHCAAMLTNCERWR
nr:MAG TPA: protein of unknown function (DUF4636) [Caudoviricetes sp.]